MLWDDIQPHYIVQRFTPGYQTGLTARHEDTGRLGEPVVVRRHNVVVSAGRLHRKYVACIDIANLQAWD